MIDTTNETLVTMREASGLLPHRPHVSTLWRWMQRGVKGVKLETTLVGGLRFTSREALERFLEATNAKAEGRQPSPRAASQRKRAIRQADEELRRSGI